MHEKVGQFRGVPVVAYPDWQRRGVVGDGGPVRVTLSCAAAAEALEGDNS
jgi:hypothetical protein